MSPYGAIDPRHHPENSLFFAAWSGLGLQCITELTIIISIQGNGWLLWNNWLNDGTVPWSWHWLLMAHCEKGKFDEKTIAIHLIKALGSAKLSIKCLINITGSTIQVCSALRKFRQLQEKSGDLIFANYGVINHQLVHPAMVAKALKRVKIMLSRKQLEEIIKVWPDENGVSSNPEVYDQWIFSQNQYFVDKVYLALGTDRVNRLSENNSICSTMLCTD